MAIFRRHVPFYEEIFRAIPELLRDPVLTLGYQHIFGKRENLPEDFRHATVGELLRARGLTEVRTLDLFDERADLRYDLNLPVPESEHERYRTVIDIGCLEHVFDTRQCLQNCMGMVAVGGHYFVHTPVHGYFAHGFHTFSPELLTESFRLNGFDIRHVRYCSEAGEPLESPDEAMDTLIWIVGQKTRPSGEFQIPQQLSWRETYGSGS